jgi:hypothetical protein
MGSSGHIRESAEGASGHGSNSHAPATRARAFDPTELLSRLWRQNLPIMRERVACLEAAAQEALNGSLTPAARTSASDIAHKMAGSLGMFGYPVGTEIAREMEQMLEAEGSVDAARFVELAAQMRAALPL